MATFDAQLSAQIPRSMRDDLDKVHDQDKQEVGRVSGADVIRAALALGLPRLTEMTPLERIRLYTKINS